MAGGDMRAIIPKGSYNNIALNIDQLDDSIKKRIEDRYGLRHARYGGRCNGYILPASIGNVQVHPKVSIPAVM